MKKRFTILTAAIALLAILAIPMGMKGQAPVGTTLWSEDFSGYDNNSVPSGSITNSHTGTTVYGGVTLTYACTNGGSTTQTYTSGGPNSNSNLLISKNGGSFTISGISTGEASELTVTYAKSGSGTVTISSSTTGVTISGSTITTGGASTISITFTNSTTSNLRFDDAEITVKTAGGGQQLTPSDLALVDAPVELEFDLYDNANAQTISYTTSSTGAVTVSQSNYITTTVNANNTITVTPVAVTNGSQTITVTQAADNTYATGSVTFTVDIEDSTPSTSSDVTFLAGTDLGSTSANNSPDEMEKSGVTVYSTDAAFATAQYRLYKSSVTTISVESGTITNIVFNGQSTSYPVSNLSVNGNNGSYTVSNNVGTWTGNSNEISFSASNGQVRLSSIVVTVETSGTPDPTISASNVDIAYSATSGSITYTINNEPSPAGTLTAAVTDGNWLTLGQGTTSPIAFTCTANENTTARTATVTLTYTYDTDQTVTANVTVTQAAAPASYTTIPDLFAAATTTETDVYVTFNNWVVSGVSTNGKNVFVTDNNGNGFIIFDNDGGLGNTYSVGDILSGTAVSCVLVKFGGYAELKSVDANDLTITSGGTVSTSNIAMANLTGVNTGALVHYENLTCSITDDKYYLSDGTTTLQVYNSLFAFDALVAGKIYNITGIYQQYYSTKEILPRSAADIEEVTNPIINAENVSIAYDDTSGEIPYTITNPVSGQNLTATSTASWISNITVTSDKVTFTAIANEGSSDRTATITLSYTGAVDKAVTVTQTGNTPTPAGGNYVRITSLDKLTNGSIVVIAARFNTNATNYYAMTNTLVNGKATGVAFTSTTANSKEILPADIVNDEVDYYWVVSVTNNVYTFTNADGDVISYNSSTNFNMNGDQSGWTITTGTAGSTTMVPSYSGFVIKNESQTGRGIALNDSHNFGPYAVSNMTGNDAPKYNFFLDLFVQIEDTPTPETFPLVINGWQNSSSGTTHDYYLIASPLASNINPANVTNMTSDNYDLYRFNQSGTTNSQNGIDEWQNYKKYNFDLEQGKGYLYAHDTDVTLTFTGTPVSGDSYNVTLYNNTSNVPRGKWNLVGNSFTVPANIGVDRSYYKMNTDGTDVVITTGGTIGAMEGIFVLYDDTEQENNTITFTKGAAPNTGKMLSFNITQGRSEAIDRAIVRFDEGQELPKFQINANHTKLYIPQSEDDYAVVRAAADGVMPLNFKAQTNGNYTISLNVENVELNTLVLIDNLTGNEVNLLSRAEYSFDATTEDDENRFTLVYSKSGETKTYKLTITADDFNTTSYAANNTEKTSNAVNVDDPADTFEVVWTSNQVMKNASGQMQWQKGNGRIYNITNMGSITDVTVEGISGGFTTYYGESIEPAWSGITGQPFFQTKTYDDAVGYSTSLEVTFDIEEGAATTYSVTFDAGEGTFVGNEDFSNTENTKAAGIYTLPDATREGYVFNGWLATGTTTPRTGSYTVYTDVEFTAQYTENGASGGNGGTDVLDLEFTGVSGTNYTSWSDKEGESGAVYAGNSAGGNSAIQLRSSNNNSGIITTASGGMISKVVVTWNENTTNGRVLNVYGKNTAYTAVTDLYNSSKQGTLLGTITCGTNTELLVSDEYTFIGLRSNSGAMYIDEISITWVLPSNVATPTFSPAAGTYMGTQTVTISCETDDAVIYYTTDGTTPDNTSEVYDGGITVSQTTTIQAIAYVGTEASHVATATYTIVVPQTIAEVREQGTGTVLTYGVVTAVSTNSNGTTAYMQDMTAAIVVYGDFTAEVGDEIQVSGTLTTFRGLLEIGTPTVTVASQNNVIDPTVMTIAEIIEDAEGDNEYQAMLVSIVEATVTEINGNNTIIAQGENTITVYGSLGDVEEDDVISFTGNIGCYNTVQIVNPTNIEIQGNTTMPTFFIDGDWFDGANWTTGEVPAAGSNVTIAANATVNDGYIAVVNEMNITSEGSLTIADGGQVKSNTSFVANLQKNITGYGNGTGKYYLITVPASVDMCSVDGFMPMDNTLHTQVDFYAFDQQHEGEEWLNYKYGYDYFAGPYVTHRGVGYLYANKNNTTLNFASVGYSVPQGSTVNYYESPFQPTNVDFNAEIDYNSGVVFAGYNLLGNPFTCNAYLVGNYQFYRMNPDGDAIIAANPGDEIKPGEGIFVVVSSVDDEIIFTAEEPVLNKSCLAINLSNGQSLKDRAIVRFDEDRNIGKFMFNENGAKLYITQDGKDCSVVGSEGIGEMPVNFKAAQNGTYTLSFSNDNVEFSYLHLIDNMTGADVDLLANPSYSFEAKSSDYASRFKLVFVVNEDNLNNNDNFAFVSNGNIVINGEGTLQVIDMTGRIVSVEEVNGMSSVNVNAAGVYVLQLTNGESVKTQKIVVK